jgi:hypothetical protein
LATQIFVLPISASVCGYRLDRRKCSVVVSLKALASFCNRKCWQLGGYRTKAVKKAVDSLSVVQLFSLLQLFWTKMAVLGLKRYIPMARFVMRNGQSVSGFM